ncbi:TPA: hypothetical protein ACF5A8_004334 [Escherichia coli]
MSVLADGVLVRVWWLLSRC